MNGLRKHTHDERFERIKRLIPLVERALSDNFLALAADGSFARGEDFGYSDLELVAFCHTPLLQPWEYRQIENGMLAVVVAETAESYQQKYLEVGKDWYAAGGNKLVPVINPAMIEAVNAYKPVNIEQQAWDFAASLWSGYQEIAGKTLNTLTLNEPDKESYVLSILVKETLKLLAYCNATPYTTLQSQISQARQFAYKPKGFLALLDIFTGKQPFDRTATALAVQQIFTDIENHLVQRGYKLYIDAGG